MIRSVEKRELVWGDIVASADTDCGPVRILIPVDDVRLVGERLDNVIACRLENARRVLLARKTDAEWLAETVNADG